MTPQMLERAYPGFARGYRDCRDLRKQLYVVDTGWFYEHDYIEGWNACMNDTYWAAQRENASFDEVRAMVARIEERA